MPDNNSKYTKANVEVTTISEDNSWFAADRDLRIRAQKHIEIENPEDAGKVCTSACRCSCTDNY